MSLSVSVSVSLSLIYLSIYLSISHSLCLSLLSVSVSVSLSLISLSLSLSLSLSSFSLSLSLSFLFLSRNDLSKRNLFLFLSLSTISLYNRILISQQQVRDDAPHGTVSRDRWPALLQRSGVMGEFRHSYLIGIRSSSSSSSSISSSQREQESDRMNVMISRAHDQDLFAILCRSVIAALSMVFECVLRLFYSLCSVLSLVSILGLIPLFTYVSIYSLSVFTANAFLYTCNNTNFNILLCVQYYIQAMRANFLVL